MLKYCKYCDRLITGEPIKGCCSLYHAKLEKAKYNANYYKQKTQILMTEKYSGMLRACMRQFGEGNAFEAEILEQMKFDWTFSETKKIVGSVEYTIIGEYGYVIFSSKKIKIIRM
ncbi:MAG: hypothetical protein FGM46_08340 [Ferruginibacter sp.]|nr:hypothetical protein [Ferruginibacter sp.]